MNTLKDAFVGVSGLVGVFLRLIVFFGLPRHFFFFSLPRCVFFGLPLRFAVIVQFFLKLPIFDIFKRVPPLKNIQIWWFLTFSLKLIKMKATYYADSLKIQSFWKKTLHFFWTKSQEYDIIHWKFYAKKVYFLRIY